MRILLVAYFYESAAGGGIIVARLLREQLQARGHTVDVLCLAGGEEPQPGRVWRIPLPAWVQRHQNRTRQVLLFLNNRVFDSYALAKYQSINAGTGHYDHIVCQDFLAVRLAARLARIHSAHAGVTLHAHLPINVAASTGNPLLRIPLFTIGYLRNLSLRPEYNRFSWVVGVSEHVTRSANRWLGKDSHPIITTIYNPAAKPQQETTSTRRDNRTRFAFLGRLSREKGITYLIEAFKASNIDGTLTVYSLNGQQEDWVRRVAATDHRIIIREAVHHSLIPQIMNQHDVICCPSMWDEPFGLTALEGRMSERVVLATDRGGHPEILAGYQRAVLINPHCNSRKELIHRIMSGLHQSILQRNRPIDATTEQLFLSQFSIDTFGRRYHEVITQTRRPVNICE